MAEEAKAAFSPKSHGPLIAQHRRGRGMWQVIVQHWIREAARQRIMEELSKSATGRTSNAEPGEPAGPPVGLVFALGIEQGGLEDLLAQKSETRGTGFVLRQGLLDTRHVAIVQTGIGAAAARRGTEALIAGHRPSWVISAGFAGGLLPRVARGAIVLVNEVIDHSGRRLTLDLSPPDSALSSTKGLHLGAVLSVPSIVRRPADKAALGQRHGALAVDLESFAVAEICRRAGTRFLGVRIITDAVGDELPREVGRLAAQRTTAGRLGAAFGAVIKRPGSVKDMLKLKEDALVASDRLAKFLAGVIAQLPIDVP